MKQIRWFLAASLFTSVALAGSLNSSVRVGDGEIREDGVSAVNGKIAIGSQATVQGACQTVNGSITVGEDSNVLGLQTVNGGVDVGSRTVVRGDITAVNGSISMDSGASASGVSTVNGGIELTGAKVEDDVMTVNGNIELREATTVGGDIVIQTRGRNSTKRREPLVIELDQGSVVRGSILVEDEDDTVEVHLRGGSRVLGTIENATVIEG
jgi:DUF4097 and DUF4098 domain-containing protein YvlB